MSLTVVTTTAKTTTCICTFKHGSKIQKFYELLFWLNFRLSHKQLNNYKSKR